MKKPELYRPVFDWLPVLAFIFFFLAPQQASGQSFSVPIKFRIEDGGFEGSQILVQRNGTTSQTIEGKDKLTLELAYNATYVISFVKPGYITKKISIDTHAPANRVEQGFEPYAYGVNLFRQYEGVNTVIFNQPVAKIFYSKKIDDFDYDVDYTKSVQSAMKEAEEEIKKKAELAKKAEAEQLAAEKLKAAEELKIKKEEEKLAAEELKKTKEAELAAKKAAEQAALEEEKRKKALAREEAEKEKARQIAMGEDKKKNVTVAGGADQRPPAKSHAGGDTLEISVKTGSGADAKKSASVAAGSDTKAPGGSMTSGADSRPAQASVPVSGKDAPAPKQVVIDDGGIKVEEITEPNRTITRVTVREPNGVKNVYTKVAYNWGATYYFRNNRLSIPDYIYQSYTQMK